MKIITNLLFAWIALALAKESFYIQTIKIKTQTIKESRRYYGSLVEKDSLTKIINARVDGYIEELLIEEKFDAIQKGDELFKIYSPELLQVQNEYINALKFKSNISQVREKLLLLEVDSKILSWIEKRKKPMNFVPIFSKYSGVVLEKNVFEGQYVKRGDPLYKVVDLSSLWLIIKAPHSDYGFVEKVKKASIEGFQERIDAEFIKLLPWVDSETKMIEIRFSVENKDFRLSPRMFVVASLFHDEKTLLVAPKESVLLRNEKFYVFQKLEEGEFEAIEIQARRLENGDFEILSGIEEGEEIAKNALFIIDADIQNNGGYE